MTLYSKINVRSIVSEVGDWDSLEQAEATSGGQWTLYQLGVTEGSLDKIYDPTYNIFRQAQPNDLNGKLCESWTLNTTTGMYIPPITIPNLTVAEDTAGKQYMWNETLYQGDSGSPKTLGWVLTQG